MTDTMTKSELIARLAERYPRLVARDAEDAVKTILDAMTDALVDGQSHRDPGIRQLRAELPAAAHRPQPEVGRRCRCRRSTCRTSRRARNCASGSMRRAGQGRQRARHERALTRTNVASTPPTARSAGFFVARRRSAAARLYNPRHAAPDLVRRDSMRLVQQFAGTGAVPPSCSGSRCATAAASADLALGRPALGGGAARAGDARLRRARCRVRCAGDAAARSARAPATGRRARVQHRRRGSVPAATLDRQAERLATPRAMPVRAGDREPEPVRVRNLVPDRAAAAVRGGLVAAQLRSRACARTMRRRAGSGISAGSTCCSTSSTDKAIDAFIEVVKLDPETIELHYALGNLFRRRGEFDRAIRIHTHLLNRGDLPARRARQALAELGQDLPEGRLARPRRARVHATCSTTGHKFDSLRRCCACSPMEREWAKAIDCALRLETEAGETTKSPSRTSTASLPTLRSLPRRLDEAQQRYSTRRCRAIASRCVRWSWPATSRAARRSRRRRCNSGRGSSMSRANMWR